MKEVRARDLTRGTVILLPFGKEGTISNDPKVGTKFTTFTTAEYGMTRIGNNEPVMVKS